MSEIYDIYIFTASIKDYADPIIDYLDTKKVIKQKYFRDSCTFYNGKICKDLRIFGENLADIILIDVTCLLSIILQRRSLARSLSSAAFPSKNVLFDPESKHWSEIFWARFIIMMLAFAEPS